MIYKHYIRTLAWLPLIVNSFQTPKMSKRLFTHMKVGETDTIYALSSGALVKAGVAVIRVSGPSSKYCLETLGRDQKFPKPRMAALRWLRCPETNEPLDKGLVIWFPGPNSFTGEDCVEFHIHSGRAVITGMLNTLGNLDNPSKNIRIRPADRGEFTQRAYMNGKMDLTEVEGLADLLAADTSQQRKQALKQMDGVLKIQYEKWREELLSCLAHTEAVIDFGDDDREDDIDDSTMYAILPRIETLRNQLRYHLKDGRRGEILREGVQIALVGPPNAGKSSLLNLLARRPASIVSPIAGTTRDVVEVRMDLNGVPCIIRDTAGVRSEESTADEIEREGMRRAKEALRQAQIKIIVTDASDKDSIQNAQQMLKELITNSNKHQQRNNDNTHVDDDDEEDNDDDSSIQNECIFVVRNKIDNIPVTSSTSTTTSITSLSTDFHEMTAAIKQLFEVSCVTNQGISEFEIALGQAALSIVQAQGDSTTTTSTSSSSSSLLQEESALITRDRHRSHVKQCIYHLDQFIDGYLPMDAAAEELRLAMMELGRVTGRVDVEELLDVIFRDFCIGK